MKIDFGSSEAITFGDLSSGDVFEWKTDIWMASKFNHFEHDISVNAVNLVTGQMLKFQNECAVVLYPDAKLILGLQKRFV